MNCGVLFVPRQVTPLSTTASVLQSLWLPAVMNPAGCDGPEPDVPPMIARYMQLAVPPPEMMSPAL